MGFSDKIDKRPVNTLQTMLDNSKIGDYIYVYENGDMQICDLPQKYINRDNSVKVENGLMLFDTEENDLIAATPQEVFNFCYDCLIFDDINSTPKQREQVLNWFKNDFGVKIE